MEFNTYKERCNFYRYVTYRGNKLYHIAYARAFNYSNFITGLTDKSKLGSYRIELDRSTGIMDKSQKMIFQNDYIKREDGKVYLVEWLSEESIFILRPKDSKNKSEAFETTYRKWSVVGNIHTKKYKI